MKPKTLISGLCILLAICLAIYFYAEWQKQEFDATLPVPPAPPAEEQAGGHWHGDEWHADDAHAQDDWQPGDELIPSVDWQPSTGRPHEAGKPEGFDKLDAEDPVAKAWAKLDDIADNPFAWGGNADPKTAGLVQQLMPAPDVIADEAHADELTDLLYDLAVLRDPRAIETMLAYEVNLMGYRIVNKTLVAMGPPVVPYLIPYLDEALKAREDYGYKQVDHTIEFLFQICTQHRAELDGVVEYIVLPKFKQLLAEGFLDDYHERRVKEAVADLNRLPRRVSHETENTH